ncbi:MAG: hypothetical protein J4G05_07930 [Chlorobi bacterium]|nr:hypothetical protein [Chlorobiota bacterium]
MDDATQIDLALDNGLERGPGAVLDHLRIDLVEVEIFTMNGIRAVPVGGVQTFRSGVDFQNGNPNGIRAEVPKRGGYLIRVVVTGEVNEDCCPGPPPGCPVYRKIWDYRDDKVEIRAQLPKFLKCDYL